MNTEKKINIWFIIGAIAAIAALVASITTAAMMVERKRKDDEELERYLDCCIQ